MFEQDFEELLSKYSDTISDRSRISGLIRDYFPGQQMKINLLLSAYDTGLPGDIRSAKTINQAFAYRFVKRLMDEYGISRSNADWAVSEWCVIYGQKVLKKPCDIKLSLGSDAGSPAIRETSRAQKKYGELFTYERIVNGKELTAAGFNGEDRHTIIFQSFFNELPVTEIKEASFLESDIEEAIMSDGYKRIGDRAFMGCADLHQIIFSETLKVIGRSCFAGCKNLKSVVLPQMLGEIGPFAFSASGIKKIQIPDSVYYMGEGVFSGCENLEYIEMPDDMTEIPSGFFKGCGSLKKIFINENIDSIGDEAFRGCTALTAVYVPDSVTSIGDLAFADMNDKFIFQCSPRSYGEEYARRLKLKYQLV